MIPEFSTVTFWWKILSNDMDLHVWLDRIFALANSWFSEVSIIQHLNWTSNDDLLHFLILNKILVGKYPVISVCWQSGQIICWNSILSSKYVLVNSVLSSRSNVTVSKLRRCRCRRIESRMDWEWKRKDGIRWQFYAMELLARRPLLLSNCNHVRWEWYMFIDWFDVHWDIS